MKTRFLLSTVLVLTIALAACSPQAAPTKKAVQPTSVPPVTLPTTIPTKAAASSTKTTAKSTSVPTKAAAATPTTASPASSSTSATAAPQASSSAATPGPALFNDITVNDQTVKSGTVLISMVDSLQPGWVAIFTDDNGQPGKLLGYVAVPKGTSEDIKVTVDANSVTPKMIAMLLTDAGKIGTFEYPGPDEPVKNANISENVLAIFNRLSQ